MNLTLVPPTGTREQEIRNDAKNAYGDPSTMVGGDCAKGPGEIVGHLAEVFAFELLRPVDGYGAWDERHETCLPWRKEAEALVEPALRGLVAKAVLEAWTDERFGDEALTLARSFIPQMQPLREACALRVAGL